MIPLTEPTTGVATDRLLEALAVVTDRNEHLEDLITSCKQAVAVATLIARPDLADLWLRFADLALAVADDHATEGA